MSPNLSKGFIFLLHLLQCFTLFLLRGGCFDRRIFFLLMSVSCRLFMIFWSVDFFSFFLIVIALFFFFFLLLIRPYLLSLGLWWCFLHNLNLLCSLFFRRFYKRLFFRDIFLCFLLYGLITFLFLLHGFLSDYIVFIIS